MIELRASASPGDWKPVPGEAASVSKGFQIRQGMLGKQVALPAAMQASVFAAVLPPGEQVVAVQDFGRVYISGAGADLKLGLGAPTRPCVAVTPSRLLIFYLFADTGGRSFTVAPLGVDQQRQYLEFPLTGLVLGPIGGREFAVTWSTGLEVQIFATANPTAPLARSGPLKAFYNSLAGLVQQQG